MAKPTNGLVEGALRSVAPTVTSEGGGRWTLALGEDARVQVEARVSRPWLEVTARIPQHLLPVCGDESGLRMNSRLPGSMRVARDVGAQDPHLRADAGLDHTPDVQQFVEVACGGITAAMFSLAALREGLPPAPFVPQPLSSLTDVEQACSASGWHPVTTGSSLRVDLKTRAGVFDAYLDSAGTHPRCFIVELLDLDGCSVVCHDAVAALLMAVSGSFRLVKGALLERDGVASAVLMSAVMDDSIEPSPDSALSALAAACQASAREARALLDARVASEYLALSRGTRIHKTESLMEEACLQ